MNPIAQKVPSIKELKRNIREQYHIIRGTPKIVFFDWYRWIDVNLFGYCADQLKYQYRVKRLSKVQLLDAFVDKSINVISRDDLFQQEEIIHNYERLSHRGLYLWEICKSSICDHLLKCSVDIEQDKEIVEIYYRKAVLLIDALATFFQAEKPHAIIVEQGFQYDMRSVVEVARWFDCKTIAIENSFLKEYFFIDPTSGGICNRNFLSRNAWDIIKATSLTKDEHEQLGLFMRSYTTTIERGQSVSTDVLRKQIPKTKGKKVALLFGQVATDAAVIMDSHVYPDVARFIIETTRIMKKHKDEFHLVVRLHPKEAYGCNHQNVPFDNITLKTLRAHGIDQMEHVTIFHSNQIDTYQLMDIADIGFVLTSQTGLEFLSRHKPLIVLGDAFYSGKGFTFDVSQQEAYESIITKVINTPDLSSQQKVDIDRFIYYMVFKYLFPKNLDRCEMRIRKIFQ